MLHRVALTRATRHNIPEDTILHEIWNFVWEKSVEKLFESSSKRISKSTVWVHEVRWDESNWIIYFSMEMGMLVNTKGQTLPYIKKSHEQLRG
jgi:hypothetical protein